MKKQIVDTRSTPHHWTPEEDRMIRKSKLPDRCIASVVGVTRRAVVERRHYYGWKKENPALYDQTIKRDLALLMKVRQRR